MKRAREGDGEAGSALKRAVSADNASLAADEVITSPNLLTFDFFYDLISLFIVIRDQFFSVFL